MMTAPPNNFREISICPEASDLLHDQKVFLRQNIVLGGYDGVEQYLDIQFRLLRENFILPLRDRISSYMVSIHGSDDESDMASEEGLNNYQSVRILGRGSRRPVAYRTCEFDCTRYRCSDLENDERLKIGSLVCLSSNDFMTIDYFATVAGPPNLTDSIESGKGKIKLHFEFKTAKSFSNKTFVMIEAPEYFEAYRHSLKVLQSFSNQNFPLIKYIVNVKREISPPSYLSKNTVYRLSDGLRRSYRLSTEVQVLMENAWPARQHLGLDESQYEAFRAALTKQLAIIQAPPGTGKIYIASRIVEALLANECPQPILVVFNSSHTLDRFLEAVRKFVDADGIIRTGNDIAAGKSAQIIVMTTNNAAKHRHIIDRTQPRITIVEEAAEVLESEIVTVLTGHTEHLILIGDHKQLRPKNAVYELSAHYKIDISLFERLIKNKLPFHQLKEQRRMRPCISSLLRPLIYEELSDHPSVEQYEDVKGMCKNMFFLNHHHPEESEENRSSHINLFEASVIIALSKYLIQQGYGTSQITILTTYKAQLRKIKEMLKDEPTLKKVHAATVDGFQSEQNEIVLVSFVRSNSSNQIGFLKTSNRISVALSRASKGLYCIGNFERMAWARIRGEHFPWNRLLQNLKAQHAFGNALEICCQIHGTKCTVKTMDDFMVKVPEGGCMEMRRSSLQSGHFCSRVCYMHSEDANHRYVLQQRSCVEVCNRIGACGHRCPAECHYPKPCNCVVAVAKVRTECNHTVRVHCYQNPSLVRCVQQVKVKSPCGHSVTVDCSDAKNQRILLDKCTELCNVKPKCVGQHRCPARCHYPKPCGNCAVLVDKLRTECQHTVRVACCTNPSQIYCSKPCDKYRRCGHKCKKACSALCEDVICVEMVEAKSPCGHTVSIKCSDALHDSKLLVACTQPCNIELKCGHLCKGSCGQCKHGRLHTSCEENCNKTMGCPNKCSEECGDICNPTSAIPSTSKIRKLVAVLRSKLDNVELPSYMRAVYTHLVNRLTAPTIRQSEYEQIKMKVELLEPLRKSGQSVARNSKAFARCSGEIFKSFDDRINAAVGFMINYRECEQQRSDITAEALILNLMAGAIVKASSLQLDETGRKLMSDAFEMARTSGHATEKVRYEFYQLTSEAYKHKISGISNKICCAIM